MSIITFQRGDKTALTKNFTKSEFACPCGCGQQSVDTELAEKLQLIRDKVDRPLKITSGYRCITHNAAVGGSQNSKHRYGMAADWRTENRSINPVALGILAQAVGFGGIGIYWHSRGAFVHADTRGTKATWLCTTPGKYPSTTYNKFVLPTIRRGCAGPANRSATIMLQKLLKLLLTFILIQPAVQKFCHVCLLCEKSGTPASIVKILQEDPRKLIFYIGMRLMIQC